MTENIDKNKLENVSIGYFAGVFDAEGTVHIRKDYTLHVKITMSNFEILKLFKVNFGGNISEQKKEKDYYQKRWVWYVLSHEASSFLKKICRYMIVKREEAEMAIKYQEMKTDNRGGSIYCKTKVSNDEIEKRNFFRECLITLKHDKSNYNNYKEQLNYLNIDKNIKNGKQLVLDLSSNNISLKKWTCRYNDDVIGTDIQKIERSNDYIAGFFDGDGCVQIGNDYVLNVSIENKNFNILKYIQNFFGGSIYEDKKKCTWIWQIQSSNSLEFLETIKHYMIEKEEQIKMAIEYLRVKQWGRKGRGKRLHESEILKREYYKNMLRLLKEKSEQVVIFKTCSIDKKQTKLSW